MTVLEPLAKFQDRRTIFQLSRLRRYQVKGNNTYYSMIRLIIKRSNQNQVLIL